MALKRAVLLLSFACAVLALHPQRAYACSCGSKPTVLAEFDSADFVLIGRAGSLEKSERGLDGIGSTKMIVERVFKGGLQPGEELNFAQGTGGDCRWTFSEKDIGERYLFYLRKRLKGERLWTALYCGRSRYMEYAADDVLYLENLDRVRGKTRLSGTLRLFQPSPNDDLDPYSSVAGKQVQVIGNRTTHKLTTNHDGVYEVYDLAPGKYKVEFDVPDGFEIEESDISAGRDEEERQNRRNVQKGSFQLVIEPRKHTYADFAFGVKNAVRGKVFGPTGNGMPGVCVTVVPSQGRRSKYFYLDSDCTDEDGRFEIVSVPPGSYVLVINREGKPTGDEPFRTVYYPGHFERERAALLTIGPGQVLENFNFNVPQVEETVTLEGVCLFSDGKPAAEQLVKFLKEYPASLVLADAHALTDSAGRFSLKLLKGVEGTLFAEMFAYKGQYENCPRLEELIPKDGSRAFLKSSLIEIRDGGTTTDLRLVFPFPGCRKAKAED